MPALLIRHGASDFERYLERGEAVELGRTLLDISHKRVSCVRAAALPPHSRALAWALGHPDPLHKAPPSRCGPALPPAAPRAEATRVAAGIPLTPLPSLPPAGAFKRGLRR
jgi:hypothetical protein